MTQYKGYYIDHIVFNSKTDIDNFIKEQAIDRYKMMCRMFAQDDAGMELSILMSEQADRLHNQFGMDYNEIEAIEIEVFKAA
jgi:hypothetical protein